MRKIQHSFLTVAGSPLRRHANGQWYLPHWNPRTKKSEQFYFGTWADDPKGERAISDPVIGWLARRRAILAGIDNVAVGRVQEEPTLGELMARFLTFKRNKVRAGELALPTFGGYVQEVRRFVEFLKPATPAALLRPEHFSAYMNHLIAERKLGRHSRRRVRAYITHFIRYGVTNGWYAMPNMGMDWIAPATNPEAMRQAKARAGIADFSDRIVTGNEIDKLLTRASPTFKALILLAINTGLGPADLGRLTWDKMDLDRGRLVYPRYKSGVRRVGYLWHKTRQALRRIQSLKHNRLAIEREGSGAMVFLTRTGRPFYVEREKESKIVIGSNTAAKITGVITNNAATLTFGRLAKEVGLQGVTMYRLRHTFRTYGQRARDREALDLCMGHKDAGVGRVYDHEEVSWKRVKRVATVVYQRLWPKVKRLESKMPRLSGQAPAGGGDADSLAA